MLITFELARRRRDQRAVEAAIRSLGRCIQLDRHAWAVETSLSSCGCVELLREATEDASFFAVPITPNWAEWRLRVAGNWLRDPARVW